MPVYDISPLINADLAVFPGDTPFRRSIALDFKQGHHLLLSSMEGTLHLGAHADAPNHYDPEGVGIDGVTLSSYWGLCQVIDVPLQRKTFPETQTRHHLSSFEPWVSHLIIQAPRLLFKTQSFPHPHLWNGDFLAFEADMLITLAEKKVRLVGIDTPSVDPADSKRLDAHQILKNKKMSVLEGIDLRAVPEGCYFLMALPLNIQDADASPVRAVLVTLDEVQQELSSERTTKRF
jgi:arylformamidase